MTNGRASLPHKSGSHDAYATDFYPNLDAGPADAVARLFTLAPRIAPHLLDRLLLTRLMIFSAALNYGEPGASIQRTASGTQIAAATAPKTITACDFVASLPARSSPAAA